MSHETLTAKGLELMELLPPFYWEDHVTQRVQQSFANEVDRIDAEAEAVLAGIFPHTATGVFLKLWEHQAGLPIAPALTDGQRQEKVIGRLRARRINTGLKWIEAVTAAIGTDGWEYIENYPEPYQVTIYAPFPPGSDEHDAIQGRVQPITAAHIEVLVGSIDGFIVDQSLIDSEVL